MSNEGSKKTHSYLLFGIIALICGLFYWSEAIDLPAKSRDAAPVPQVASDTTSSPEALSLPGGYQIPNPETKLESLSLEDYAMLQSLPSICVAEVPGIKDEDKPGCPATDVLAEVEREGYEETGEVAFAEVSSNANANASFVKTEHPAFDEPPLGEPLFDGPTTNDLAERRQATPEARQVAFASTGDAAFTERGSVVNASFEHEHKDTNETASYEQVFYERALSKATAELETWSPPAATIPTTFNSTHAQGVQSASFEAESKLDLNLGINPHAKAAAADLKNANYNEAKQKLDEQDIDPHLEAFSRSAYPSAVECSKCHEQIFEEWASSSHAYASISPMFHVFEDKINKLSQGTIGYFCMRCHAPVATTMGLRRDQAIWDGPRVFREGVTCVACHRVKTPYGKTNGERHMTPGGLEEPIVGGSDGKGVHLAADKYADWFKTKTDPQSKKPGQLIHGRSIQFEELSKSSYCISCHQVAVEPGIKLEVVWDQYRASPAYREGITCQECHMGSVPGVAAGYSFGPAAVVNGKVVNPERKHSNHLFYGPGYSIAHPGLFPHNVAADRWKFNEWLAFDWRAGWGSKEFEKQVADYGAAGYFPHPWDDVDARMDAREIVDANLEKLAYKKDIRIQLLENGSKLDGPFFNGSPNLGERMNFRYCLTNTNPGHNMPSGSLGAQPQIWMNVVLSGPDGSRLWETGYLDSNGDLCDNHSLDVLARRAPLDDQLLNLQTKFLVTNVKGTEREMYLPIPFEQDQLPFIRPAPQPVSVLNHPVGIRMEGHSLPPLGSRNIKYSVPAELITQPGTYSLSVRLRSRAEPIYFMRFCNATPEMMRMMNEWIADFHEQTVVFEVR